ncbi:integral membrane sensor signal transduction histidine kinase [Flammeovirgaceae bacterium 311]|nr:integral membrane sensor signal transduction histidine kinase [Flammeovirgaceae bacterium 311]
MIFKSFEARLNARVVMLFVTLSIAAYLLVSERFIYCIILAPVAVYQLWELINFQHKAQAELRQFVESIQYRDFSRHFDVKHAPVELQDLRKGFNEINTTFKTISKEKETQYHYLQKILELVDTGILSYDLDSGEVVWMNESLKKLLHVPYLRTIHSLEKRDPELQTDILELKPGDSKIATAQSDKNAVKVLLSATAFQTDGHRYKLIAFQNIHEALDETESKAWQRLLSVMTHEIMNSIAPISSLADTLKNRLQESLVNGTTTEDVEDLEVGISTIKRRSEGLLKFAETYRSLNKITTLNLRTVSLYELFANLKRLMQPTLSQKNISLEIILKDQDISVQADPNLLDQVLINLLVNAIEATKNRPDARVVLSAYQVNDKQVEIKVADNGSGMSKEVLDKIFIPFFSTKKQGSGIGLSLCKQIIMLHRGTIQVQSVEGVGTAFLLRFV